MFGFFEADNDPGACQALFNEVEEHCLSLGIQCLEGPFNPNHYSELGMLSENYSDPPAFFETYNPPYYNSLMSETGFKVAGRLHTRINRQIGVYLSKKYDLSAPPARKEGFTVRKFRLLNYGSDLECIRQVNNDAFSDNYRFLPLTKEEYRFAGKYMFLVTVPRLVIMVEHRGTPVAVLQCVLNINTILHALNGKTGVKESLDYLHRRRGLKELVIFSVGIRKAYQNSPVFVLLLHHICRLLKDYSVLSTTWMTDTNIPAIRAAERLGLHPYKWFDIFEKTF